MTNISVYAKKQDGGGRHLGLWNGHDFIAEWQMWLKFGAQVQNDTLNSANGLRNRNCHASKQQHAGFQHFWFLVGAILLYCLVTDSCQIFCVVQNDTQNGQPFWISEYGYGFISITFNTGVTLTISDQRVCVGVDVVCRTLATVQSFIVIG